MILGKIIQSLKSAPYLIGVLLLILVLDLLINLLVAVAAPGVFLKGAAGGPPGETPSVNLSVFAAASAPGSTTTPYQPVRPTEPISQALLATTDRAAETPTSTPTPQAAAEFYGIDLNPGSQPVVIRIYPPTDRLNNGKAIAIHVRPGGACNYEDHRACVGAFLSARFANIVFATVHSGLGGEAEAFRQAVEGLGPNRAAYSLKRIHNNLEDLVGAQVAISQGGQVLEGFRLLGAGRVPPTALGRYFRLPIGQALELAALLDPAFTAGLAPDRPMLIFETCGWKLPSEPWAPGVSDTTGSVYLGVIQKSP